MTYQETTEFLFNQMPMFERQGASGYKEGLQNTVALDNHFGNPHRKYRTIHVAGTNGKGSCSHTIAAILQAYGYKVGLYTSPHLADFRERIRVDGCPISERYVVDFVENEREFFTPLHPSFFEVTTALAFKYFADTKVDIAVVEVGLGGRLDCTNIISPELCVITNISLDHTQFLGNTPAQIAGEKAGIIKPCAPVIIGEATAQTRPVFEQKAKQAGTTIVFAEDRPAITGCHTCPDGGMDYTARIYGKIHGDLGGIYQQKNTNTVLTAFGAMIEKGIIPQLAPEEHAAKLNKAIGHVAETTGLAGRWQLMATHPTVICDTGHNTGGWSYLSRQLKEVECKKMHIVFGMVADKDIDGVLEMLPQTAAYYFTQPDSKRALPAAELAAKAGNHSLHGKAFTTVEEAYREARKCAGSNDFIFVGGSSYVVADFLKAIGRKTAK